ncbi:uncharacterized protein L201_001082 [Kwoniella dendrophila CBS 6074]|uniref:Uncharacterized protein n=1 Tax=Kwoniella dendrophila CBS 6074 TaxID=1295534 RepID=A0AAX4JMU1_9TREE
MSHFRRSNFGRFTSSNANEHYQRQLTAPVNKWKRQWISPTGLAPESSYKICKWVKQKEKAKLVGAIEIDDNTPIPEGEENEGEENDEDQEMEEDDQEQGDEEDGEEGDGEGEGEGEEPEKTTTTAAQTPAPESQTQPTTEPTEIDIPAAVSTEDNTAPSSTNIPTEAVPNTTEPAATTESAQNTETTVAKAVESTTIPTEELKEVANDSQVTPAETKTEPPVEENHEATIPPHNSIPSNAIEMTAVAPTSTESGLGTIATNEPTIELETRPSEDAPLLATGDEEKMEIEEETVTKQVEEDDKGLVHGEMDAPTKALEIEEADVPKEVEKE